MKEKGVYMEYNVNGILKVKGNKRKFAITMEANSESHLRDKVAAYFGSKFGINRNSVEILEVKNSGA
jgi:ribosomal protein L20A (L18A)